MSTRKAAQDVNDYRIVVLGSANVGKTSLLTRFIHGAYKDSYTPTVEDTFRRVVSVDSSVCALHITDTGGSHYFPAMKTLAIQRGHAFLLVYAVDNRKSFEHLQTFYTEILSVKMTLKGVPHIVVGNKCDSQKRQVTEKEGAALAHQWKCPYMETSAKQIFQIQTLFEELLSLEKGQSMSLETTHNKKKKSMGVRSLKSVNQAGDMKHKCIVS